MNLSILFCSFAIRSLRLVPNSKLDLQFVENIPNGNHASINSYPTTDLSGRFYLESMQCNENLIMTAFHQKWIGSLCFYYRAKAIYQNSCYYDHSLRKTAAKLDVSYGTLKNHLDILQEKGLIRFHCGNLIFVSVDDIKQYSFKGKDAHKCTIDILKTDSLNDIKRKLRIKLLEFYSRHQLKAISDKDEVRLLDKKCQSPHTFPTMKEVKKRNALRHLLESQINRDVTFTDATLSKLLYCSRKTLTKFKRGIRDKVKVTTFLPERIIRITDEAYTEFKKKINKEYGKVFYYKGWLYKSYPTTYAVLNAIK